MDALDEVIVSKRLPDLGRHPRHESHAEQDIVRVSQLDSDLRQR